MARIQRGSLRRGWAAVWMLVAILGCGVARAQSSEAEIRARLVGKPLFLRGFWRDEKLKFDSAGRLKGNSRTDSFTVSGAQVEEVYQDRRGLHLSCRRMGLVLTKKRAERVGMNKTHDPETIQIDVDAPADGDYGPALKAIFAEDLRDLLPSLPEMWQHYVGRYLATGTLPRGDDREDAKDGRELTNDTITDPKKETGIQIPKLIHSVEPKFSPEARENQILGSVLVSMMVEPDGSVDKARIERGVGFGLDESAAAAVEQYRFAPPTREGKAVPMLIVIEIDFRLF